MFNRFDSESYSPNPNQQNFHKFIPSSKCLWIVGRHPVYKNRLHIEIPNLVDVYKGNALSSKKRNFWQTTIKIHYVSAL